MLACNLSNPRANGSETIPSPIVATNTSGVIMENTATSTIIPTETPTTTPSIPPEITLIKNTNCRVGPSTFYNISDQIEEKKVLPIIGRSQDSSWWQVDNGAGRVCWVFNENAEANTDFSGLQIGDAPPLPGTPGSFLVVDQLCQPGPKIFTVTLSWVSGGGETSFRLFRNGNQLIELKSSKLSYKDPNAPFNKNISYEIEAVNSNGTSQRAVQIVPACK